MTDNTRPVEFQNYLPEIFREDNTILARFLNAPEVLYEELEAIIEGTPGDRLQLTFKSVNNIIMVEKFNSTIGFSAGAPVIVICKSPRTELSQAIPDNQTGLTQILVIDASFVGSLQSGDIIIVGDTQGNHQQLTFQPGITIEIENFESNSVGFPIGTYITASKSSALRDAIPAYQTGLTRIEIDDVSFVSALNRGDILKVNPEGLPSEILQFTFESLPDTIILVSQFSSLPSELPVGTLVSARNLSTTLRQAIPSNKTMNRIEVMDTSFVMALRNGDIISVNPEDTLNSLTLTFDSLPKNIITVTPFNSGSVELPEGTEVSVSKQTTLVQSIEPDTKNLANIVVRDYSFAAFLNRGNILTIHTGGLPDLFGPATCPPPQLRKEYREESDFEYLKYLAGWIALPLRSDIIRHIGETDADYASRMTEWNRMFFKTAIPHYKERSTIPGIEWLLRAWLKDDMVQTRLILTDLTRAHTDVETIFQLGETSTVGVDTVLGEGPPFFFIADLVTNPNVRELRNPVWLDVFQRAARFLLDSEKPAHTYYQLRVRAHTMQLDPEDPTDRIPGEIYAQVGDTTMLWDAPWIYTSD